METSCLLMDRHDVEDTVEFEEAIESNSIARQNGKLAVITTIMVD